MNKLKSGLLLRALALCFAAFASAACTGGHGADALWSIVHERCVPDQSQHGDPKPCALVDLLPDEAHGSAVLKDRNGPYQYLLIPTARVSGIESPLVYAAGAANYFAAAWAARRFLEHDVGHPVPREALSLAINSRYGRSQNQLHIHIDCLKPEVEASLHALLPTIGDDWAPLPQPLAGHRFDARRIHDADLGRSNPFRLLPAAVQDSESERARHTLVIAGARFSDTDEGFILLDGVASLWTLDRGHGEALQNHACPSETSGPA